MALMHEEFKGFKNYKPKDARRMKMDVPEETINKHLLNPSLERYNINTKGKPSIVPIQNQEVQRLTRAIAMKKAYDLHCQVHDRKDNYTEDAHSFFCEVPTMPTPSSSTIRASSITVGTDCSGIEIPIQALINMGIPFHHIFSSDTDDDVVKTIKANYSPDIIYGDIQGRDNSQIPEVDVYVAGFPCQPFSTMGKQEGFQDQKGRGVIFFDILDYIT